MDIYEKENRYIFEVSKTYDVFKPFGWVTLEEASSVAKKKRDTTLIGQIARRKLVTAYPDETALDAFKRMSEHETGRVLVFDRDDPKKLVGVVTKTDLMHTMTK